MFIQGFKFVFQGFGFPAKEFKGLFTTDTTFSFVCRQCHDEG